MRNFGWRGSSSNSPRIPQASLLLALALLSTGCVSLTPPPGRGMSLRYTPREPVAPVSARPGIEAPGALPSPPEPETPQRLERDARQSATWPGEWNRMIMKALREAEVDAGRMLTRSEVLDIVAYRMRRYGVPMEFIRWRGQ
jgi:hypothetical protein